LRWRGHYKSIISRGKVARIEIVKRKIPYNSTHDNNNDDNNDDDDDDDTTTTATTDKISRNGG